MPAPFKGVITQQVELQPMMAEQLIKGGCQPGEAYEKAGYTARHIAVVPTNRPGLDTEFQKLWPDLYESYVLQVQRNFSVAIADKDTVGGAEGGDWELGVGGSVCGLAACVWHVAWV
jgi:hypothetical protein